MSSAESGNTVCLLMSCGIPAFGWQLIGKFVTLAISSISGLICSGPREQLIPMISAPMASTMVAATAGGVPVIVRPSSLKENWQIICTSSLVFSASLRASKDANKAARISCTSIIVSMMIKSTPPSIKASACSLYVSYISSKLILPKGCKNRPVGPIEPATRADGLNSAIASLATFTAAIFISFTRFCKS